MNVILFGGTGMVGQGVLRECLLDAAVQRVLSIVRKLPAVSSTQNSERLSQTRTFTICPLLSPNFPATTGCFFTLGVTSGWDGRAAIQPRHLRSHPGWCKAFGKAQPRYDLLSTSPARVRTALSRVASCGPGIKGKTEKRGPPFAIQSLVYVPPPASFQPLHGIKSKTRLSSNPLQHHDTNLPLC